MEKDNLQLQRLPPPTGLRRMALQSPDKSPTQQSIPQRGEISAPPETQKSSFDYETHTQEVKAKLRKFGFGPTVECITSDGLDRKAYLAFAREKLLGPEGQQLPQKIGEVDIPENVRTHAHNVNALFLSFNVGYGHYRVATEMEDLVEVLGGKTKNVFLGAEDDVIPRTNITDLGGIINMNRLLRGITRLYRDKSNLTANQQGMLHELPVLEDHDAGYTRLAQFLLETLGHASVGDLLAFKKERTDKEKEAIGKLLTAAFRRSLQRLIRDAHQSQGDELVISTHAIISEILGKISPRVKKKLGYVDANFEPDVAMIYDTYTESPPTYTEKAETVEKWGYKQGLDGQPAKNSVVLDGYLSPLSVFARDELRSQRKQALTNGQPLTVIATASGIAPAQLDAFKDFVTDHVGDMLQGKLRMVIQCGAEEGMGMSVYNELQALVAAQGLEDWVVLHIAKNPPAAIAFFKAASWAPVPLALLVKGSEMTRIAQSLDIPVISTGALGAIEYWNVGATLLDNPTSIVFPPKTAEVTAKNLETLQNDILVQKHPEKDYVGKMLRAINQQTAQDPQQLLQMVKNYITSEHTINSSAGAMLYLLSDMLYRKHPEEKAAS